MFKSIDLFASSFKFRVDGSGQGQKTIFGSIVTLLIVLSSIAYLTYDIYRWVDNQIKPTITT